MKVHMAKFVTSLQKVADEVRYKLTFFSYHIDEKTEVFTAWLVLSFQ
jgi:hypothetical protein